jgi:EAL domain-containing protein (putative c-di-GMP-specific phosphodiesterase class I)
MGWWVLEQSCRALAARHDDRWVAVNVSVAQLRDPALLDRVLAVLTRTGLEPRRLLLEITEQAIADGPEVVDTMRRLRALGLRLAMDDFGTGYSSLASLAGLPLDALKIDGSFVARLDTIEGEVLVRAVVDLARALGLRSVAEGVEERWQLDRLREIGCDAAQGFLLGRPAEAPALASLVAIAPSA